MFFIKARGQRVDKMQLRQRFRMRRKILMADFSVLSVTICHLKEKEKEKENIQVPCFKSQAGSSGMEGEAIFVAKTRLRKRYFVCREYLLKRTAERSAFINREV